MRFYRTTTTPAFKRNQQGASTSTLDPKRHSNPGRRTPVGAMKEALQAEPDHRSLPMHPSRATGGTHPEQIQPQAGPPVPPLWKSRSKTRHLLSEPGKPSQGSTYRMTRSKSACQQPPGNAGTLQSLPSIPTHLPRQNGSSDSCQATQEPVVSPISTPGEQRHGAYSSKPNGNPTNLWKRCWQPPACFKGTF